jgi:hypothetical protein
MRRYIALILRTAAVTSVTVPDLPRCAAIEVTLQAALEKTALCARARVAEIVNRGRIPPTPRSLAKLRRDPTIGDLANEAEIGIIAVREPPIAMAMRQS